jgi:glutamyl-tRNA synthetase
MIKTRFAPSPTGVLHVGGARTALFCWLYSKQTHGKFVLRIEDTDLERSTAQSVKAILDAMQWLGLDYDEGPYYQTQRFERYQAVIRQLIEQGDAYYCQCSRERLDELRARQMADKQKPRYDGRCRDLGLVPRADAPMVIRFRNPQQGVVSFRDHVKGVVSVSNGELDDLIIERSDGSPTYNLSVVVDDMDMAITHVLRGDDHVNNTPRQVNILRALDAPVPEYAHVPMILGDDGKRLSKRHGAVGVMEYCEAGYLPEAMLNYLVRLGWSHGDQEIFSRAEMIELFSLDDLNNSASTFNTEKLNWINQQYLMSMPLESVTRLVEQRLQRLGISHDASADLSPVVELYRQRSSTINELVDNILYVFQEFEQYDEKAAAKVLKPQALLPLQRLREQLGSLSSWTASDIHGVIEALTRELEVGMGKIGQPLRVAITGGSFSPPIDQTAELLGRDRCLARLDRAIEFIGAINAE